MSSGIIMFNENVIKKVNLCYMNTGSSIVYMKTEDIYADIAKDVEVRFNTSNYELDRPSPKELD